MAYLEPHEEIWKKETGQWFNIKEHGNKEDTFAPFRGLHNFPVDCSNFPGTFFRFPLRNSSQEKRVSSHVYNTTRLRHTLTALREEAKVILLFLRSVRVVEVHEISERGACYDLLKVNLSLDNDQRKRDFYHRIKMAFAEYAYNISMPIELTVEVHVDVIDEINPSNTSSSTWVVASRVCSQNNIVHQASAALKALPWVGIALEIAEEPSGGRVFCVLPMPSEVLCHLPVHVNATFSLNDERRELKWPGIERRNDVSAEWNDLIIEHLLPPCYADLLLNHARQSLTGQLFYKAWPDINRVRYTKWESIMKPLFQYIFTYPVFWSHRNEWVDKDRALFTPRETELPTVVTKVLSDYGAKIVTVPTQVWDTLSFMDITVTSITPQNTKSKLCLTPNKYAPYSADQKLEMLGYCLSDGVFDDLVGIALLPLADGTFTTFLRQTAAATVYVCSSQYPSHLIPGCKDQLVDITADKLHQNLTRVADSKCTQLTLLHASAVASLLHQYLPKESIISIPHPKVSLEWLEIFWRWVAGQNLDVFSNLLVVPIFNSLSHTISVVKLSPAAPTVFIPSTADISHHLQTALGKFSVQCCEQSKFPFVNVTSASLMNQFLASGVLDAIYYSWNYSNVALTTMEAAELRKFLYGFSTTAQRKSVLQKLAIFSTASGSLCSAKQPCEIAPTNFPLSAENLPPQITLFCCSDYCQLWLLINLSIPQSTSINLLLNTIFPLISDEPSASLMTEVLQNIDLLVANASFQEKHKLKREISTLAFLPVANGSRKSPLSLFDPSDPQLQQLFRNKPVFPLDPFCSKKCVSVLKCCGLKTEVSPQEIIEVILDIGVAAREKTLKVTDTTYSRAKAVMEYIRKWNRNTLSEKVRFGSKTYTLSSIITSLSKQRCWLPIQASPSQDYPGTLTWMGNEYCGHLSSYGSSAMLCHDKSLFELACGTQMYFVDHSLPSEICELFYPDPDILVKHVMAHLEVVIHKSSQLTPYHVQALTQAIYQVLYKHLDHTVKKRAYLPSKCVYIARCNVFVSPNVVAIKQNKSFRHNLEPFIYTLPDNLLCYSFLFKSLGVVDIISKMQIVSILGKIKDGNSTDFGITNEEAWEVVMTILNWLTGNGEHLIAPCDCQQLCVPVEPSLDWPTLIESQNVVFTDNDFLRRYVGTSQSAEQSYNFVSWRISPQMANQLRLTPLSHYLDIAEDAFEDVGQSEPLTVRLKNILKDYKDGLTIVKELLQNADDAGATEVNICYDARNHRVNPDSLLFPGMEGCHGPALVVHNNAMFTQDDFRNITKLAGATKQCKTLKIGKFGVGFCSVYHMTDIPSFISNKYLYIFDPTLTYLKNEVTNPAQPGKRVLFTTNIVMNSQQLTPYLSLFGFDKEKEYKGTMFRFPFRILPSELSDKIYTADVVGRVFEDIGNCSSELLLFLQKVNCITVSQVMDGQESADEQMKITKAAEQLRESLSLIGITCSSNLSKCTRYWLVATHTETVLSELATASVGCSLSIQRLTSHTQLVPQSIKGQIFCFLPLSKKTGLPVHISSNFAVSNNRTGIWTSDDPLNNIREVKWNESLMKTVIPTAYLELLVGLKQMSELNTVQEYVFYILWPLKTSLMVHNPWNLLISELYCHIENSSKALLFSACNSTWLTLANSQFLASDILRFSSSSNSLHQCVLEVANCMKLPIVDLPQTYHAHLHLRQYNVITESIFLKYLFVNMQEIDSIEARNEVLCLALECFATELDHDTDRKSYLSHYLTSHACIPSAPHGETLRKCIDMISPNAMFAALYEEKDGLFPLKSFCHKQLVSKAMEVLGMKILTIPMHMLIERAKTVCLLYKKDKCKALTRSQLILQCLDSTCKDNIEDETIANIPFLPVMPKPKGYTLEWFGEDIQLLSGQEVMLKGETSPFGDARTNIHIAGSQVPFIYEVEPRNGGCGYFSSCARRILHIRIAPTPKEVIDHLKCLIKAFNYHKCPGRDMIKEANTIAYNVYQYLEETLQKQPPAAHSTSETDFATKLDLSSLSALPCVWTGTQFVHCDKVALEWKMIDGPYLYRVPDSIKEYLREGLQIKEKFTVDDIIKTLQQISDDYISRIIPNNCKGILIDILSELSIAEVPENHPPIMLPDEEFIMHEASQLAFNDAQWLKHEGGHTYVNHKLITRDVALKLGVKMIRNQVLNKFRSHNKPRPLQGRAFGQHETLTSRIQGILKDYPFDATILKELLQNADDAKATKFYVILDTRMHVGERVLTESWQELQGPALLVWNDSEFTEDDIEGIQNLGIGNKRSDAETIGQYGIGFNSVYHLTDCPSFLTGGMTLCIFDPHLKYTPEPSLEHPGEKFEATKEFWSSFQDMKPPYLRGNIHNCPKELLRGSLFRFPLRHSPELVEASKIICENGEQKIFEGLLSVDKMKSYMEHWAPQMKQSMFFLNHVTEIKMFTITEEDNVLKKEYHYRVDITELAVAKRLELQKKIAGFKDAHQAEPFITKYQLSLVEEAGTKDNKEQWLIQQGIGDVEKRDQHWLFINQVKPRHGIAAPLRLPHRDSDRKFCGKVFCFLPLPIDCNLPVHINGHFILHSSRRGLWKTTDRDDVDSKQQWNKLLLQAIASSYAHLLMTAKGDYRCESGDIAMQDVKRYYRVFPSWTAPPEKAIQSSSSASVGAMNTGKREVCEVIPHNQAGVFDFLSVVQASTDREHQRAAPMSKSTSTFTSVSPPALPTDEWLVLAHNVFRALAAINAPVLAAVHLSSTAPGKGAITTKNCIEWCLLKHNDPALQAHFVESSTVSQLKSVLERIGMKLTCAPHWIRKHFVHIKCTIPTVTPSNVYKYYDKFHENILKTGHSFPCSMKNTAFRSVDNFGVFFQYIKQAIPTGATPTVAKGKEEAIPEPTPVPSVEYPPLLVTADGILRYFHHGSDSRVIASQFSSLFQSCLQWFLHPKLTEHTPNIFLLSHSAKEDERTCMKVDSCMRSILPAAMADVPCVENTKLIYLKLLWKCLGEDEFFNHFLSKILKKWTLLLSVDDKLYSCYLGEKAILPIIPPTTIHSSDLLEEDTDIGIDMCRNVYKVCQQLKLPFLDTDIVPPKTVKDICPTLCNPRSMLQILFYFHCKFNICPMITDDMSQILFDFFGNIHLRKDTQSLELLKGLPLYLTHMGTFSTLNDKSVYVWPDGMLADDQEIWLTGQNIVFLNSKGAWSTLGLNEELKVNIIAPVEIYTKFIFQHFRYMTETLRYKHLQYIRDSLLNNAITQSEQKQSSQAYQSRQFISELQMLECIGSVDCLKPIHMFYDHHNIIFRTFEDNFLFLPEIFQGSVRNPTEGRTLAAEESNSWRKFFEKLGLHVEITTWEYLELCQEMANKRHTKNTRKKSRVLFNYLFQKAPMEWFSEYFISTVVNLQFVIADNGEGYTWIAPLGRHGTCIIQTDNSESVYLTKLDGACVYDDISLVWSVKPVYRVPDVSSSQKKKIFSTLQINHRATTSDVIKHLITISESGRADPKLFDTYTAITPSEYDVGLVDVIAKCFRFLNERLADDDLVRYIDILKLTACIPVAASSRNKIVLVKPCQALTTDNATMFFPYLHKVPCELMVSGKLLERIQVKSSIQPCHIQLVLKAVYDQLQNGAMDPNTVTIVSLAIDHLGGLIIWDNDDSKELSPLFLPGQDKHLHHSLCLVYPDTYSYKGCNLPPGATNYSLIHHPSTCKDQFDFANRFCSSLPLAVRPKAMSQICYQQLTPECTAVYVRKDEVDIEMARCLKIVLKLHSLPIACRLTFLKYGCSGNGENIEEALSYLFEAVEVVTIKNLEVNVVLKSSNSTIGTARVDFFLEQRDVNKRPHICLYLDSGIGRVEEELIHNTMTQELLKAISKSVGTIPKHIFVNGDVQKAFRLFLKSQTNADILKACQMCGIGSENSGLGLHTVVPTIGSEIPAEWHYMLDQNPYNIFHPLELVGYEKREGCYVFAKVLYAVPPDNLENEEMDPLQTMYMITVVEGEEKAVTALDIHKFLKGKKTSPIPDDSEMSDNEDSVPVQSPCQNAAEAKRVLIEQLKQIWKLKEPERSRAIRRLYLQWHPDKNLDNVEVADEVFKFLLKQIDTLQQGLELQDDDDSKDDTTLNSPSPHWKDKYSEWEDTARSHKQFKNHHSEHYRNRRYAGQHGFADVFDAGHQPQADMAKACLWVEQAAIDMRALEVLYDKATTVELLSSHVCFMAHEVAEKALKGGMYATCGLPVGFLANHEIFYLARALHGERVQVASELPSLTAPLVPHYLDTRFPNRCGAVPSHQYSITTARQARENARKILEIITNILALHTST